MIAEAREAATQDQLDIAEELYCKALRFEAAAGVNTDRSDNNRSGQILREHTDVLREAGRHSEAEAVKSVARDAESRTWVHIPIPAELVQDLRRHCVVHGND